MLSKTRDYFDQKSGVSRTTYKFLVCYIMCLMLRHNFLSSCYCDSGHFINITGQFSISKILFFHTKDLYVLLWLSRKFSLPFTLNTGLRGKVYLSRNCYHILTEMILNDIITKYEFLTILRKISQNKYPSISSEKERNVYSFISLNRR